MNQDMPKWMKFKNQQRERIFQFKVLNPAICFRQIKNQGPRSIILTSGTLTPLEEFESELQTEFKFKLVNEHIIQPDQIVVYGMTHMY